MKTDPTKQPPEDPRNIVALDFMSLVHPFTAKMSELEPRMIPVFCDQWVKFFGNPYLYCPQKNPVKFNPFDANPVLLVDLKEHGRYWRHDYHAGYKTGRSPKSTQLLQIRDLLLNLWLDSGLPSLSHPGFEADDWAGGLVKYTGEETKIALVTVDSDWEQLVSDRVMWLDVFPPSRRKEIHQKQSVLGPEDVLTRFNNQVTFKRNRLLTCPFDLVDYKHEFGDSSDRIPRGRLVDIGIIDLLQPCKEPPGAKERIQNLMGLVVPSVPPPKITSHHTYGVPGWLNDEYSTIETSNPRLSL